MSLKIHQVLNRPSIKGLLIKELTHRRPLEYKPTLTRPVLKLISPPHNDLSMSLAALNINSIYTPSNGDPIKSIIQPPSPISKIVELPHIRQNITYEDSLPTISIEEPTTSIVKEKQAARLIVIRRHKMKKHKLKKLRKRMKYERAKVRQRRELQKEKLFQAELLGHIKLAQSFDPAKYVAEKIAKAKEVELPVHWHGVRYPEHIIKQLIEEKEKKEKEIAANEKRRASMSPYVKDYLDKLPK